MHLLAFQKRFVESRLMSKVAPTLFCGMVLFGSSCANVRELASNPFRKGEVATDVVPEKKQVEHALAGKEKGDQDFIKLLEHKMNQQEQNSRSTTQATTAETPSVQELISAGKDPFLSTAAPQVAAVPTPAASPASTLKQTPEVAPTPKSAPFPADATQPANTTSEVQQVAFRIESIQSHAVPASGQTVDTTEANFSAVQTVQFQPEPRLALNDPFTPAPHCNDFPLPFGISGTPTETSPEVVGDEYIHDGGDAGTKVYYSGNTRYGLDVEDTVVEWLDEEGVVRVKPSTRASVYAPRFAAVRSASLPHMEVKVDKLAGHQDRLGVAGIDTKLAIDEKTHHDEALAMLTRSRPSGLESMSVDNEFHQNIAAQKHVKLLNVYEDFRFFREGKLEGTNSAVIGDAIAAALEWNGDRSVMVYAHDQAGQEVQGRVTAQDYTGVEDRSTPGDLTISKIVDKTVAKSGDELTFTIRFDNVGDRPLKNVRVVDNLSPRLKYLDGSVDSDLNGRLDTADNGRGSQVLTFVFEDELKGHTGGWVSFKCVVR